MRNRKFNENDINILVKKIINEGSIFAGIKGFFSGDGYNYSKYKYEINEVVIGIRKKLITDNELKKKLLEIYDNLDESSANDNQKDELMNLISKLYSTIQNTNDEINDLIKKLG
jgi:hypothetical protein